jgi:uncharacterized pyridoxal phosphate-containing UPF0001 family protein
MTTSSTSVAMTTYPASSANGELLERVAANLVAVRARIASTGRDTATVRIVAVTKTFAPQYVRAAAAAGLEVMGENYVEELVEKRDEVTDLALTWHYLGALQSNKIHRAVLSADVLCGVSRLKEIERIASTREGAAIYAQVDFTGSALRIGAAPRAVAALVERGRSIGLDVRGLMTVAPIDPDGARSAFRATTVLADDLGLSERSMGMTNDLEAACELGSSEVRVGRALFGPRELVQPPDLT